MPATFAANSPATITRGSPMARGGTASPESRTSARLLADLLYGREGVAADAVRTAAGNILLVLCVPLPIPWPFTPVPVTGQTFGVLLIAVLLGARRGMFACVLYLLEG